MFCYPVVILQQQIKLYKNWADLFCILKILIVPMQHFFLKHSIALLLRKLLGRTQLLYFGSLIFQIMILGETSVFYGVNKNVLIG